MMDTERQDQGRGRGKRRFDECAAARREGGSFEVSRSDEPKEELTDPLRGEHTPERADVTSNSYEEPEQEQEQQQHFGARWEEVWPWEESGCDLRSSEAWEVETRRAVWGVRREA